MDIKIRKKSPLTVKTDFLVIGVFEKKFNTAHLKELDQRLGGLLSRARRKGEFSGKDGEYILFQPAGHLHADRVLFIGLGSNSESSLEKIRRAAGNAMQQVIKTQSGHAVFDLPRCAVKMTDCAARTQATSEGILLASYRYDRFLSEEARRSRKLPSSVTLLIDGGHDRGSCEAARDRAIKLCRAVALARDLVNAPGNIKSPGYLAEQAQEAASKSSLACTILDQGALVKEGFGALLGVAQGSQRPPHLILLEHKGGKQGAPPIALVGKGVVFDAGGISLKPAEKMDEMKMDMAGGAAVIGVMLAAAELALPINLVGIVPTVENLPSGTAYRPGDILTSLSGQTIEVLNTDAEGRLILADALSYAKRYQPEMVIDLATLTGACIIALGHHAAAVLGNDQKLVRALLDAGQASGERLWQLPLYKDYTDDMESDFADIANLSKSGGAGTATAAAFLQEFVPEGIPWAHLDIAGTAWLESPKPHQAPGATLFGSRLLAQWIAGLE